MAYKQKKYSGYSTKKMGQKTSFKSSQKLKIMVLGGLEEVGRNMTLLEYGQDIIIIDMGLQFPEEDMPGIDYIIPNISYLKGKEKNIKGVVITHSHYDHIGAIPHIIPKIGNPIIYTAKLSVGIIQKRQEEYKNLPKLKFYTIDEKSKLNLGSFNVEFFRVNHNIPDSFGVVVHTPVGTIIHTGDFKIDHSPINDIPADLNKIARIGAQNVLALMADSTNAEEEGHQISETHVSRELERIFEDAKGRIIVGTFASLLNRVQQIITMAEKFNRKVMIEGRSMRTNVEISHKLGYLKIKPGTLIESENYNPRKYPDDKIIIIGSGAQGEQNAFLVRFANDEHRYLQVKEGDTIIFSSSVVPGNERTIQNLKDTLYRKGAKVIHYKMMDVHAGGHAKKEDLKLIIRLLKPQYYIPIEANHYMLRINGEVAESIGIPKENIFIANNGQIMEFTKKGGRLTNEFVPTDYVMVDGLGVGDISNIVLRDRRVMAADGMLVVIATIQGKTGKLMGNPDIISRGFVYMKENKKLIESTRMKVKKICEDTDTKSPAFDDFIKNKIRDEIGQYLYKQTKRRPMILPVVIKV
ncbi:MAG: RNase J family beta-CASP ribonuclease [Candidatus Buchananbacteria bacterium]|nr:RNase J family beta-CASP ribonuclease [Candidatus Buchananbacteria bacterium]